MNHATRATIITVMRPQMDAIVAEVADSHGFYADSIMGRVRWRPLAHARFEAVYRLREELNLSYPVLAEYFGHADHTSVLHAHRTHRRRLAHEKASPPETSLPGIPVPEAG